MHNLRRFYYQNKEKIWKVVLIIAFLLGIIYFVNAKLMEEYSGTQEGFPNLNENSIYSDAENNTYISDKGAIYGETITEKEAETINNTISKFLKYCKEENIEKAYNMLSSDCKENEYNTIEEFKENYLNQKFGKDAIYEIQKWIDDIYRVSISQDLLATGDLNNNSKTIEYIAIITENSEEKLNINSYLGKHNINKEIIENDVKINVISKKTYLDYEIYNFEIENLSDRIIKLDTLQKIGTMYLEDSNGNKYNAYAHEIFEWDLEIRSNFKANLSIRYANTYSKRTNIEKIVFENVILDHMAYKSAQDESKFEDICKIEIEI